MINKYSFIKQLINLQPKLRRLFLMYLDVNTLFLSNWVVCNLFNNEKYSNQFWWANIFLIPLALIIYYLTGQYKPLSLYVSSDFFYKLTLRNIFIFFIIYFFALILNLNFINLDDWILIFIVSTGLIASSKLLIRDLLLHLNYSQKINKKEVLIYGAGAAGAELARSLRFSKDYLVKGFIDDSPKLWDRMLLGLEIKSPEYIKKINHKIDKVLLAIPSINQSKKIEIIRYMQKLNISLLQIPTLNDISSGKARIDSLREIALEDLLFRKVIKPDSKSIKSFINLKNVLITGAGGSIGSELSEQIIAQRPNNIVLFDHSEHNLYLIHQKVLDLKISNVNIVPILGNARDSDHLGYIFKKYSIDIVYHAAAYKHVPLLEINPIQSLVNNVISTKIICEQVIKNNVSHLLLVSSDKAVRPTNIMGASKRLSELILLAHHKKNIALENTYKVNFSIVRFGNVLGSSGSVVPKFKNQIKKGGPITLTHPEITRYFMTIEEAAELVIQASSFTNGGDVFLLDMGNPIKVKDLAEQMIKLSGLKLKNSKNPSGDIEIKYVGLRPGEKLYEELLVDGVAIPTKHPLIYKSKEFEIDYKFVFKGVNDLEKFLSNREFDKAKKKLKEIVPEWKISNLNLI